MLDTTQHAMPPVAQRRDPTLDGIRGIAILLVLVGHLVPYGSTFSKPGVTIFFGLSGYLITRLLINEHAKDGRLDLRAFYIRRVFRLAPALLLVLVFVAAWCLTFNVHAEHIERDSLLVVFYVANWGVVSGDFTLPLSHMWSLSVEEQFYFLWPLVVALLAASRRRLAVIAGVAGLISLTVAIILAAQGSGDITYRSDTAAMLLLIGCLGALLEAEGRMLWANSVGIWLLVGSLVGMQAAYFVVDGAWVDALFEPAVAAGATVAAIGARNSRLLRMRWLVWLGLISYSLYLWQTPVTFNGVMEPSYFLKPMAMLVILPLAWATHKFVEKPLQIRGRELASRSGRRVREANEHRVSR